MFVFVFVFVFVLCRLRVTVESARGGNVETENDEPVSAQLV